MKRARVRYLALLVASVAVAAACSSGGAQISPSPASSTVQASSAPPTPSSSPSATEGPAPAGLLNPGEISACISNDSYPPLDYTDAAGEPTGFEADAFRAVAKRWGVEPKFVVTTFDGLIPDLQAGRCDLVWAGLFLSEKRLAVADGVPELATGLAVMVPVGNPAGIRTDADLCGKKISIQSGGVVEQTLPALNDKCTAAGAKPIEVQAYPKVVDEFQQIIVGRADGVLDTDMGISGFMLENAGKYEIGYAFPKDGKFGIYMGKGKTEIKDALSEALRALKADNTLLTLATKYQIDPGTLSVIE